MGRHAGSRISRMCVFFILICTKLLSSTLYSPSVTYGAGAMLEVIITVVPGFNCSAGSVMTCALKVIWSMCPNVGSIVDCSMYALLFFDVRSSYGVFVFFVKDDI